MKIQEIYDKYRIMPQLQSHQLRVASVALVITDNFNKKLDRDSVITAALLHDIGNIVKFDLKRFPEHLEPKGYEYWKDVQEDYYKKYGKDDYEATYKILREIGIGNYLFELINNIEVRKAPENVKRRSFEIKITQYADMRVAPYGVVSIEERFKEVKSRFIKNKGVSEEVFNRYKDGVAKIEKQIFNHCAIKPEEITSKKVEPLLKKLRNYNISLIQN